VAMLVGRSRLDRMLVAHVVPMKGADHEWVVRQISRDLMKMGHHGKVILRTDQEPALLDLMREVAKERDAETILEESPVGDSKGNGFAERAVQQVEEMLRVHKLALETRVGQRVSVTHPAFAWLVEHVADVINKSLVMKDGTTAYERAKGRKHHGEMLEFATPVMHRVAGKVQGGVMTERWHEGLWLGKSFSTNEHVVSMEDGRVVRARTVRERPTNTKLTVEMLDTIKGLPWMPTGTIGEKSGGEVSRAVPEPVESREDPEVQPRGVKIRQTILDKVGYTPGCPKCRALQRGDTSRMTLNHTPECRKRVEEEMEKDEKMRAEVEAARGRKESWRSREAGNTGATDRDPEEHKRARTEKQQEDARGSEESRSAEGTSGAKEDTATRTAQKEGEASSSSGQERARETAEDADEPATHYRQLEESRKREREAEASSSERTEKASRTEKNEGKMSNLVAWVEKNTLSKEKIGKQAAFEVAELFSPPRVAKRAREVHGLRGGWSLDIRHEDEFTGRKWNLLDKRHRAQAKELLRNEGAELLICSPPCMVFSSQQNLNP